MDRIGPMIDVRAHFPEQRKSLLALLNSLTPAQWEAHTGCPGWDVHDIAVHVLHDHLRRLSGGRDRHHSAPARRAADVVTIVNAANEGFVRSHRFTSPRLLIELLSEVGPPLDEWWKTLDLQATARVGVTWAVTGNDSPTWLDVAHEYSEYWCHEQQIRLAVGAEVGTDSTLAEPALDTYARALTKALRGHLRPPGTTVLLTVTGDGGGSWATQAGPSGWMFVSADIDAADASITLSANDFWLLATRGITPEEARGRAKLTGDRDLTFAATEILSIVR